MFPEVSAPDNEPIVSEQSPLDNPWILHTYSALEASWKVHGFIIPSVTLIANKLLKAQKVINDITEAEPVIGAGMSALLVPPSDILSFPIDQKSRSRQPHIILSDYVNSELHLTTHEPNKTWQMLVAYAQATGVEYGTASNILKHRNYMIADYDTRALGLRQYAALTMQINKPIDENTWTILLNEWAKVNGLISSVTFLNGQYRFDFDEPNSILGDERFRPAVEIKGK